MEKYKNRKGLITTPIQGRGDQIEQECSLLAETEMTSEEQDMYLYEEYKKRVLLEQEYSVEWYNNVNR